MSEEIHNAPVVVPQSILLSILVNGALGFAMLISTLFVADDIQGELNSNPGYTWVAIIVWRSNHVLYRCNYGAVLQCRDISFLLTAGLGACRAMRS